VLEEHCRRLRSLHVKGRPLVLPNAWDVASAKAIVEAGCPVVATSSRAVAATLGYDDHEEAPATTMFDVAERIVASVALPVTVDAEAGYGLSPPELVGTLAEIGGCNLEDSGHCRGGLRDATDHARWLAEVRAEADARGYPLVINARVDVFVADRGSPQTDLLPEALDRSRA
jgi:2-methylisocitrate lyase-like PEP mutase family enzyme